MCDVSTNPRGMCDENPDKPNSLINNNLSNFELSASLNSSDNLLSQYDIGVSQIVTMDLKFIETLD